MAGLFEARLLAAGGGYGGLVVTVEQHGDVPTSVPVSLVCAESPSRSRDHGPGCARLADGGLREAPEGQDAEPPTSGSRLPHLAIWRSHPCVPPLVRLLASNCVRLTLT